MISPAPIPPITGTTTVAVPLLRAFEVFTGSISAWWPHRYHIGQADIAEVILQSPDETGSPQNCRGPGPRSWPNASPTEAGG